MKKPSKRILAVLLAVLVAAGCGFGAYQVYRSNFGGAVAVYSMDGFTMTNYYEDNPEYDGEVTTEGMQAITLSDTQTVQVVMVQVGDQVKAGDTLFSYDSTLTEIDLQKQALSLQQLELDLVAAKKQYKTIASYRPGVAIPGSKSSGGTISSFTPSVETEEEVVPTVEGLELLEGGRHRGDTLCLRLAGVLLLHHPLHHRRHAGGPGGIRHLPAGRRDPPTDERGRAAGAGGTH